MASSLARFRAVWALVAGIALAVVGGPPAVLQADDAVKTKTGLQFAPEDAAFFGSMLNNRQQVERFTSSKAFEQLQSLPAIQLAQGAAGMYLRQSNPQVDAFKEFWGQLENQELSQVLLDAVSHEVFVLADASITDLMRVTNELNRQVRKIQADAGDDDPKQNMLAMIKILETNMDKLKTPTVVFGFRLSKADAAKKQLTRLEQVIPILEQLAPVMQDRVKLEKIGDDQFVVARIDGQMIPYEKMEVQQDAEELRDAIKPIVEKLKQKKGVVALGVRGDYLLLAISESTEQIAKLGSGKPLTGRRELAPLVKAPAQPWSSFAYVSGEFLQTANSPTDSLEQIVELVKSPFGPASSLPEELRDELVKDMQEFIDGLKKAIPKQTSVLSYSYMTPRGYEGYAYNYGVDPSIDSSKTLTILDHVGENPLLLLAGRRKSDPQSSEILMKAVPKLLYYTQKIAELETSGNEQEIIKKLKPAFEPLLKRLGQITREQLEPALADGQFALVIDDKTTNTQWHKEMPAASSALGFPSPALMFGLSDAEKLKQACQGYFALAQEALDKLHELAPEDVPEVKIPVPSFREFPEGGVYYYPLPADAGLAQVVAPNAAVSPKFAVLSMLPQQSRRLLEKKPLVLDGPLAKLDRPLASVVHFNFAGWVELARTWAEYISEVEPDTAQVILQLSDVWPILKCYRGSTVVTYVEDDVTVSHSESHYVDLAP